MARWEQYEIWVQNGEKWEMLASFLDFEVASAVARNRSSKMKVMLATYEDGAVVSKDVIAELGTTRAEPTG
jgi:Cys-tRNA synthase (O-phospho-L-seryl-tRNA:Cys-tRNA synthase)